MKSLLRKFAVAGLIALSFAMLAIPYQAQRGLTEPAQMAQGPVPYPPTTNPGNGVWVRA